MDTKDQAGREKYDLTCSLTRNLVIKPNCLRTTTEHNGNQILDSADWQFANDNLKHFPTPIIFPNGSFLWDTPINSRQFIGAIASIYKTRHWETRDTNGHKCPEAEEPLLQVTHFPDTMCVIKGLHIPLRPDTDNYMERKGSRIEQAQKQLFPPMTKIEPNWLTISKGIKIKIS